MSQRAMSVMLPGSIFSNIFPRSVYPSSCLEWITPLYLACDCHLNHPTWQHHICHPGRRHHPSSFPWRKSSLILAFSTIPLILPWRVFSVILPWNAASFILHEYVILIFLPCRLLLPATLCGLYHPSWKHDLHQSVETIFDIRPGSVTSGNPI